MNYSLAIDQFIFMHMTAHIDLILCYTSLHLCNLHLVIIILAHSVSLKSKLIKLARLQYQKCCLQNKTVVSDCK